MATPAPFSRLQLAAALLEYDNDPDNPDAPYRSAQESAIFLPLRRLAANRPPRKSDYLGVALPSESGTHGARESVVDNRRSRASRNSIDALRNPFGLDDNIASEDEEGQEMEVDLTSWGLDAFMSKDKEAKHGKGKGKASTSEPIQPMSSVRSHKPLTNNDADAPRRVLGSRSMSVGNIDLHAMNADQGPSSLMDRRRSFGSPLDLAGVVPSDDLAPRRFALDALPPGQPQSIPFPTTSVRSPSPANGGLMNVQGEEEDNPFAVRPPSRGSRFDPKSMLHSRTMSNASMGSRMLLENDGNSVMTGLAPTTRDPRYSTTLDLLRPKVLVMPSPLQPASHPPPEPQANVREGFQLSTDGPPLPPGARAGRRMSNNLMDALSPPSASNLFTPNPSMNLSLSQMTFRNTLAVGGQASSSNLPKAMLDGEQIMLEGDDADPAADAPPPPLVDESGRDIRPAGKLYGKSLIDDLEARKANMRSKQRVFTGDQRPSMMDRSSTAPRASTLIDPATLQPRPTSSFAILNSQPGPDLARQNSTLKPLLNFDDEGPMNTQGQSRPLQTRSVFGVDHVWESEMAKLKEIEAQETLEEEERKRRKGEADAKKSKKRKGKSKKEPAAEVPPIVDDAVIATPEAQSRVSAEPPVLPQIPKPVRRPPPVVDDGEESESDDDEPVPIANKELNNWHDSSDEEREFSGPRRTIGTGPRYPKNEAQRRQPLADNSDDEDVPLSVAAQRTMQRHLHSQNDDSDEEKPLSVLLEKTKLSIPPVNFDTPLSATRSDDEDEQPLGLRASKFIPQQGAGEDDDDRPLALHPDQQRRTQYQMLAQQQQMMMQAQFHNSMFFPPPNMMAPGFFPAPMMPQMMMQPPMQIPSPPPMHDEVKFGRVDKWRRDVAVDSDP